MLLFVLEAFVVHCLKDNQDVLSDAGAVERLLSALESIAGVECQVHGYCSIRH